MKKLFTIILAALLFAVSFNAYAVPAYPYPIKVTQPDGTVITIRLHGDEYLHWATCGNSLVAQGTDGYWHYATFNSEGVSNAQGARVLSNGSGDGSSVIPPASAIAIARQNRQSMAALNTSSSNAAAKASSITSGEKHFLILLIQFSDKTFKKTKDDFVNMLNSGNYSYNGATGSVKEYYNDMSSGSFTPVFDVYGPITVPYTSAQCANNDTQAVVSACQYIDQHYDVDFSQYCNVNSSLVDNVFFFFPGYNQAEGGGSDTIWPHAVTYPGPFLYLDGVGIYKYGCASEFKGSSGSIMAGIGTFCHEFGHILGLPDFYDVDYETNGSTPYAMGEFSLMSSGNYNNEGRTPPSLTAIERQILGWMPDIPEWTQPGTKTIRDITTNEAFMTGTGTSGEYFVYETRGGSVWDSKIGGSGVHGLLIYHVDKSRNNVSGATAASLWNNNMINAYGDHPCCQPMPSDGVFSTNPDRITYPGARNVKTFNENSKSPMVDWNGNQTGRSITDISYADGVVTLNFGLAEGKTLSGTVKDVNGKAIVGASVVLTPISSPKARPAQLSAGLNLKAQAIKLNKAPSGTDYSTTISSDGTFSFNLNEEEAVDFTLTVSCYGYIDYAESFRITVGNVERDIVLRKIEVLPEDIEFQKFDGEVDYATSVGEPVVAAIKYTAEEMAVAVNSQIATVSYALNGGISIKEARLIIDFGEETVLNLPLTDAKGGYFLRVDVSSYNIVIPSGKDVYVGIYVDAGDDDYPFLYNSTATNNNGFYVRSLNYHNWRDFSYEGSLAISFIVKPVFSQAYLFGYNGIANPKDGLYKAGETFKLELVESVNNPESVEWFFDGNSAKGSSVTVTEGDHVVKAVLHFSSGRTETIEQIITGSAR